MFNFGLYYKKMDIINDFYAKLDAFDFTVNDAYFDVNTEFIHLIEELEKAADPRAIIVNREREALQFVKTAEDGLKPKLLGTHTNEKGEEIPVEWPDKRNFSQSDYVYIMDRYRDSRNLFLKTEYGLFLYHSGHLKKNEEIEELIRHEYAWSNQLWAISNTAEKNYNLVKYFQSARHLFLLGKARKKASASISDFYNQLLKEFYDRHLNWDFSNYGSTRLILDSTDLIINNYNDFKANNLTGENILDKNHEALKLIANKDPWESIYIADNSYKLAVKIGDGRYSWRKIVAQQYERLAETGPNYNNVGITFIDKALRIYREIKSSEDIERLSTKYQKQRNETQLSEVAVEMPQEATDRVIDQINSLIMNGSVEDIIAVLVNTPMLADVDTIRELGEKLSQQTSIMDSIPVVIQDKFGNTIESYPTEEEKKEYAFMQHYSMHFQMASQTLLQVIFDAVRAGKLDSASIIKFLEATWINEPAVRRVNSEDRAISHLQLLKSGIELLYAEMEKWIAGNGYVPDFVSCTDSLTLKVEYLLREMCIKLGIVTFKQRPDSKGKIVMEKLFDDLIRDLKGSLGDDNYYFIKFIMTDKIGLNLRNQIAHGLMDNIEYGIESPFLVLCILMKLSMYKFEPID
jgi:hypothetical protein